MIKKYKAIIFNYFKSYISIILRYTKTIIRKFDRKNSTDFAPDGQFNRWFFNFTLSYTTTPRNVVGFEVHVYDAHHNIFLYLTRL